MFHRRALLVGVQIRMMWIEVQGARAIKTLQSDRNLSHLPTEIFDEKKSVPQKCVDWHRTENPHSNSFLGPTESELKINGRTNGLACTCQVYSCQCRDDTSLLRVGKFDALFRLNSYVSLYLSDFFYRKVFKVHIFKNIWDLVPSSPARGQVCVWSWCEVVHAFNVPSSNYSQILGGHMARATPTLPRIVQTLWFGVFRHAKCPSR